MKPAARLYSALIVGLCVAGWPAISSAQGSSSGHPAAESPVHGGHDASHAAHTDPSPAPPTEAAHEHAPEAHGAAPGVPSSVPPITDADRAAAFPDLPGHAVRDNAVNYYVLFDQLEWQAGDTSGLAWDNKGWVGRDRDRLWFRSEIESEDGRLSDAEAHVLYGRAIARWWEVVAGVRHDFRPGPQRTWAAVGIQGLAPYWFEVEATAYVGESGMTAFRFETEYELLVTNRLIAQPLVELNIYGKSDPQRGIGAGLSRAEAGLRLRYEIRRELAPYVGVSWGRQFGRTADFAKAAGDEVGGARLATGLRVWF